MDYVIAIVAVAAFGYFIYTRIRASKKRSDASTAGGSGDGRGGGKGGGRNVDKR